MFRNAVCPMMAVALVASLSAPALAQNRFVDQAREAAARRAENKAVREAEHPEDSAKPATTNTASTAAPVPPQTVPAAQSAPPAPAQPDPVPAATPAPAQ